MKKHYKNNQKLIIEGELPDFNTYVSACNAHYIKGSKMKSEAEEIVIWEAQKCKLRPIEVPCFIEYIWYAKNTKKDPSNISSMGRKIIEDALQKCHILKQDSWKFMLGHSDEYFIDPKYPHIEVIINYN